MSKIVSLPSVSIPWRSWRTWTVSPCSSKWQYSNNEIQQAHLCCQSLERKGENISTCADKFELFSHLSSSPKIKQTSLCCNKIFPAYPSVPGHTLFCDTPSINKIFVSKRCVVNNRKISNYDSDISKKNKSTILTEILETQWTKRITSDSGRDHRQFLISSCCPCCPRQLPVQKQCLTSLGDRTLLIQGTWSGFLLQKQINRRSIPANQTLITFSTLIAVVCCAIPFPNRCLVFKDFNDHRKK